MPHQLPSFSLGDITSETFCENVGQLLIAEDYAVAQGLRPDDTPFVARGQMVMLKEARIAFIRSGEAIIEINLTEYLFRQNMIVLLPRDTIVNIKRTTDDYSINGTLLVPTIQVEEVVVLDADDDVRGDTFRTYRLLCDITQAGTGRSHVVEHLQRAMVENILAIEREKTPSAAMASSASRRDGLFQRFRVLVSRHARTERSVAFYADALCVSPHYLMGVVGRVSGRSVMQWVERAALLQAKVLLQTSGTKLSVVASEMGFRDSSAFCRWFKRVEGRTCGEFVQGLTQSS